MYMVKKVEYIVAKEWVSDRLKKFVSNMHFYCILRAFKVTMYF